MNTYLVTGSRPVAGRKPGDTINEAELFGADIDALMSAGHIAPAPKTPKADKAEAPKE
jgi:hypothetical protein